MEILNNVREFMYGRGANRKADGAPLCHPIEQNVTTVLNAEAAAALFTLGLLLLLQVGGNTTGALMENFRPFEFVLDKLPLIFGATTILSFIAGLKIARADVEARTGN